MTQNKKPLFCVAKMSHTDGRTFCLLFPYEEYNVLKYLVHKLFTSKVRHDKVSCLKAVIGKKPLSGTASNNHPSTAL